MGIDCEFRSSAVLDVESILALPGVHEVRRPGEGINAPSHLWEISTMIRWVGEGYDHRDRGPKVAALMRALRRYCTDLEYGGDSGPESVQFVPVTDELILEIEQSVDE